EVRADRAADAVDIGGRLVGTGMHDGGRGQYVISAVVGVDRLGRASGGAAVVGVVDLMRRAAQHVKIILSQDPAWIGDFISVAGRIVGRVRDQYRVRARGNRAGARVAGAAVGADIDLVRHPVAGVIVIRHGAHPRGRRWGRACRRSKG